MQLESKLTNGERKIEELLAIRIKNSAQSILLNLHYSLLSLYQVIGKKLSGLLSDVKEENVTIQIIAIELKSQYGGLFNEINLDNALRYSALFSNQDNYLYTSILSWEEIVEVVRFNSIKEREDYINGLLNKLFDTYSGQNQKYFHYNRHEVSLDKNLSFEITLQENLVKVYSKYPQIFFCGELINSFLFKKDVSKDIKQLLLLPIKNKKTKSPFYLVLKELSNIIEDFRIEVIKGIVTMINMSYWEIGKIINSVRSDFNYYSLFRCSNTTIRRIFKSDHPDKMVIFSIQVYDEFNAIQLSRTVFWEYIIALFKISEPSLKIYLATKAAEENISIDRFNEILNGYSDKTSLENLKTIQSSIEHDNSRKIYIERKLENDKIIESETIFVSPINNLLFKQDFNRSQFNRFNRFISILKTKV